MPSLETLDILAVASVFFFASLVRAVFGFGDALVAMPMLASLVGLRVGSPVMAMVAVAFGAMMILPERRALDLRGAGTLLGSAALGIPVGLFLLDETFEVPMRVGLGLFVLVFAVVKLWPRRRDAPTPAPDASPPRGARLLGPALGFLAGVMSGAYNIAGPPAVLYGTIKGWSPATFRATLQGFFLTTGTLVTIGHGLRGLWTPQVLTLALASLPAAFLALFVGIRLRRHLNPARFEKAIYILLLILGARLLVP